MANDKEWQRSSDKWVKSMHEFRLRKELKEQRLSEQNTNKIMQKEKTQADKIKP